MKRLIFALPLLALAACETLPTPPPESVARAAERASQAERLAAFRCAFGTASENEKRAIVLARLAFDARYGPLLSPEQAAGRERDKAATDLACGTG
ncbi:MAG TPA: hypothetical protein VEA60_10270 [Allosphingosinicella sp.]|nr:hypothetical protein [Allosphingosinicella sp.]